MADTDVPPREPPVEGLDEDDADAAEEAVETVEEGGEPSFEELLESTFYWDADAVGRCCSALSGSAVVMCVHEVLLPSANHLKRCAHLGYPAGDPYVHFCYFGRPGRGT